MQEADVNAGTLCRKWSLLGLVTVNMYGWAGWLTVGHSSDGSIYYRWCLEVNGKPNQCPSCSGLWTPEPRAMDWDFGSHEGCPSLCSFIFSEFPHQQHCSGAMGQGNGKAHSCLCPNYSHSQLPGPMSQRNLEGSLACQCSLSSWENWGRVSASAEKNGSCLDCWLDSYLISNRKILPQVKDGRDLTKGGQMGTLGEKLQKKDKHTWTSTINQLLSD